MKLHNVQSRDKATETSLLWQLQKLIDSICLFLTDMQTSLEKFPRWKDLSKDANKRFA